jgi:hypothetical protein
MDAALCIFSRALMSSASVEFGCALVLRSMFSKMSLIACRHRPSV